MTCAACGQTIVFGGKREGPFRFCNDKFQAKGATTAVLDLLPQVSVDLVMSRAWQIFQGACPACHGPGPVDAYKSYRVYSVFVFTSHGARVHVSCRSCATKSRLRDIGFSLLFGWWAFPWGLIMTPVQVVRNVVAMGLVRA